MPTRSAYLTDFLLKGLDPMGLTALLVLLLVGTKWLDPRSRLLLVGAIYGFLNVALGSADFMIGFRYLVPYLPLLYVSAALGIAFLWERIQSKPTRRKLDVAAFVLAIVAAFFGYTHSQDKLRPFEKLRHRVNGDSNTELGQWLARSLPKDTVVVARDIGEIGYWSDLPVIDMTGLTDRKIARKPGNLLDRELDLDDLCGRNPGAFVFVSRLPGPISGPRRFVGYSSTHSTTAILSDERMQQKFTFVARYPSYERLTKNPDGSWRPAERGAGDLANSYFLELYLPKDLAQMLQN